MCFSIVFRAFVECVLCVCRMLFVCLPNVLPGVCRVHFACGMPSVFRVFVYCLLCVCRVIVFPVFV